MVQSYKGLLFSNDNEQVTVTWKNLRKVTFTKPATQAQVLNEPAFSKAQNQTSLKNCVKNQDSGLTLGEKMIILIGDFEVL